MLKAILRFANRFTPKIPVSCGWLSASISDGSSATTYKNIMSSAYTVSLSRCTPQFDLGDTEYRNQKEQRDQTEKSKGVGRR